MEEIQKSKLDIRKNMAAMIAKLSKKAIQESTSEIEERLFDFANFLESKIALLYIGQAGEVSTDAIIKRTYDLGKIVVLPLVNAGPKTGSLLYKIDDFERDMTPGPDGLPVPDPGRCRPVPIDCIDIAIIPGIAFDEKGGRIGVGDGYYDRLIPNLPITTRKVALAFDSQVIPQVPVESHDKFVDIIITEKRIIYKI